MEIDPIHQIQSISDFRAKTEEMLGILNREKTILLTQHGKTCAVLVDPKAYEEQLERLRLAEKIFQGEKEIEEGKGISHAKITRIAKGWMK